jgi:hypothetical protein
MNDVKAQITISDCGKSILRKATKMQANLAADTVHTAAC